MTAIWMRARNELRSRWRALLSLALIAGLGGGAAIAALAGARRTVNAYPRFRTATHAFDDLIGINTNGSIPDQIQTSLLNSAARLPAIIDSSLSDAFNAEIVGPSGTAQAFPDVFIVGSPDGRLGTTIDAMKLESGRYADPTRADQATVSSLEAEKLGARVGSSLTLRFPSVTRTLTVVGIGIIAGSVDPASAAYTPVVIVTPAFYAQNDAPGQRQGPTLAVRVRGGLAGLPELEKEMAKSNEDRQRVATTPQEKQAAANGALSSTISATPQNESVRRTALFEAVGLAIFGGLALLTVLAIFAQLLARQIFLESNEQDALRALGMSRPQLFALSILRVGLVGFGACVVSIVIAIAASPLFPIGFMHRVEESPGARLDAFAIGAGAAGILVLIVLSGLVPALRASAAKRTDGGGRVGTNRAANALAGASFPPAAVAGIRMALEPGHGSTAVPVRTTIFGTVLALAALHAALTFGTSLQHLVSTPSLSGWNYDAIVNGASTYPARNDPFPTIEQQLRSSPDVQAITLGTLPNFEVNGIMMSGFSFAPGPFGTSIATGRAPQGTTEIAFGLKTLRALHTSIGKTILVSMLDPNTNQAVLTKPIPMRIVGAAVTPQFFFTQFPGNYAGVVSQDFIDSLKIPGVRPGGDSFYVRFKPGVAIDVALARIRSTLPPNEFILKRASTSDLANLNRISGLPNALAALLALVAAGTLAHTLVSSVRRRRRDLAVLRALGFVRRQVAMTVAWQATTIALISLAIGLPLGAIAGRLAWRFFVSQLGYVPFTVVPVLGILLAIPAALVLANLIASIPARAAARTEPAVVLRAE